MEQLVLGYETGVVKVLVLKTAFVAGHAGYQMVHLKCDIQLQMMIILKSIND